MVKHIPDELPANKIGQTWLHFLIASQILFRLVQEKVSELESIEPSIFHLAEGIE